MIGNTLQWTSVLLGGGRERGIKYYQNLQEESVLVEERLFVCHLKLYQEARSEAEYPEH